MPRVPDVIAGGFRKLPPRPAQRAAGTGAGTAPETSVTPLGGHVSVCVVDDNSAATHALKRWIEFAGYQVSTFRSAEEFLQRRDAVDAICLVIDVQLPGMSGLKLAEALQGTNDPTPIIFMTGHGTIPMAVEAMKRGATDFLPKPFSCEQLLSAIQRAAAEHREGRRRQSTMADIAARLACLTPREHQVLRLVARGMMNKQIAHELGTSVKTIKVHRARGIKKMRLRSVADLVRQLDQFDSSTAHGPRESKQVDDQSSHREPLGFQTPSKAT